MRKQELIQLHGLLTEVEKHCPQEVDLSDYESLGISPSSIYRRKEEHRAAVFALAEAITEDLRHDRASRVPTNPV